MRSRWKHSYISTSFYNAVVYGSSKTQLLSADKVRSTSSRSNYVLPFLFHKILWVHDGLKYHNVYVKPKMYGHKIGEYFATRIRCVYKRKKKKKDSRKRKKK
jgi:ribosomal protein S19